MNVTVRGIDLNCDMGELPTAIADGTQESLMPWLTSVNIACGGHAGDDQTMRSTIEQATRWKLAIGAHPGYPDRANFGRIEMNLAAEVVADFVFEQVGRLAQMADAMGTPITHVKPHGAMYNQAVNDRGLSAAIARGVGHWSRDVVLVGLAGSAMLDVFQEAGFRVAAEAFVDRRYELDGALCSRKLNGALISDPAEAAAQAVSIAVKETVVASGGSQISVAADTLCIHGDTPGAPAIAAAVAQALRQAGVTLGRL